MMDQQSAITYLLRRKEALNREIVAFRENLSAEIESVQKRLNIIPPAAYIEAQRLIDSYKSVLKALERF